MKYLESSFSVYPGMNKNYRDNYDKIDWTKKAEEKHVEEIRQEVDKEILEKLQDIANNKCKKHPKYKGVKKPKDCQECLEIYNKNKKDK